MTADTEIESPEEDGSLEEDDTSSVDTDVTQLYAPRSNRLGDEALPRQSNDDDIERVEERASYYSYGDFEPRNSGLEEMKLDLQTPSKTSSRYGGTTDGSRSFWLGSVDAQGVPFSQVLR
ncbi:MAG: hypothetical protein LQ351_005895 [Letrouitia transgressa]|nr:MAG: hypothetical protein LQ351_005895 [Letrouitia transgressa]